MKFASAEQALTPEQCMTKWGAECDAASAKWIREHKGDPCSACGAADNVVIIPMGSVAKLTPICPACREKSSLLTKAFWDGFEAGRRSAADELRRRSRWTRLYVALLGECNIK